MAENVGCTDNGQEQKFRMEVYEQLWSIQDWESVQRNEESLASQTFEFETGNSTQVRTKWLMGIKICEFIRNSFRVFWKLIDSKGFPEGKVQATRVCSILRADSSEYWTERQDETIIVGQVIEVRRLCAINGSWEGWINVNGELVFKLKLIIMEPQLPSADLKIEMFRQTSLEQVCLNFGSLLGDESTADLKIRTSDGKELLAHKAILKAQCSVFEAMFRSDLSEKKTGVVNVKDVDSKTMGILLHYFYTGNLLQSWKDEDTIVEFTYAVGKYQLTNVLKLLDEVLGSRDEEDATNTDIILLDLVQNLGLKTAEEELVARIKKKTNKVNSGIELLVLYGIKQQQRRDTNGNFM